MSNKFEGVFLDITIDEEGDLIVSAGSTFSEEYPEEWQDYLQDLLAGLYGVITSQNEAIITTGKAVRSAPGFSGFNAEDVGDQLELDFEPAEELLEALKAKSEDSTVIKFDPKKHRKH